jgi:hypothetical protein
VGEEAHWAIAVGRYPAFLRFGLKGESGRFSPRPFPGFDHVAQLVFLSNIFLDETPPFFSERALILGFR